MAATLPAGILLAGNDLPYLMELSTALRSISRSVVIAAAPGAVRGLSQNGAVAPAAAVVCLDGSENLGDVHAAMDTYPDTTFLFLSATAPPRAALAHAVHRHGGEVIPRREGSLVIAATLVAMMAHRSNAGAE